MQMVARVIGALFCKRVAGTSVHLFRAFVVVLRPSVMESPKPITALADSAVNTSIPSIIYQCNDRWLTQSIALKSCGRHITAFNLVYGTRPMYRTRLSESVTYSRNLDAIFLCYYIEKTYTIKYRIFMKRSIK